MPDDLFSGLDELFSDLDLEPEEEEKKQEKEEDQEQPQKRAAACRTTSSHVTRRLMSERALEEVLPWEWEQGAAYHVFSFGDVDSFTYFKHALRQQRIDYALLSTWCMAKTDIDEIRRYLEIGRLGRIDFYVGEIFKGSYGGEWLELLRLCEDYGGRAAIFRNHSKVIAGIGERFAFVIESSANVNTNPRSEQTVITLDRGLFDFYKEIFDGIVTFDRENKFEDWKPYEI